MQVEKVSSQGIISTMKLSFVDSKAPTPSHKSNYEGEQIGPMLDKSHNKSEKMLKKMVDRQNKKTKKRAEKNGV